jgi:hypothetical protein
MSWTSGRWPGLIGNSCEDIGRSNNQPRGAPSDPAGSVGNFGAEMVMPADSLSAEDDSGVLGPPRFRCAAFRQRRQSAGCTQGSAPRMALLVSLSHLHPLTCGAISLPLLFSLIVGHDKIAEGSSALVIIYPEMVTR